MKFLIIIGKLMANFIYFFFKLLPTKNKITFISRQSNVPSIDMILIERKLPKDIKVVKLCKMLDSGILNKIKYLFHMIVQMYHIATSKIVVLDTYCILIGILKHKKSLNVVQMWHALGSFKKFGKSIIDKDEAKKVAGLNAEEVSNLMGMHKNYDYIFASSSHSSIGFSEAFGYSKSKFKILPMARLDLVISEENKKEISNKIYKKYQISKKKKTILYCPTFRKDKTDKKVIQDLIDNFDYKKYNLIIKLHPLTNYNFKNSKAIIDKSFQTYEMGFVSDIIVTDYSAVIFELSYLNKPIYLYAYDMNEYINKRDFYLDYEKDMPGKICDNLNTLLDAIDNNEYDLDKINKFRKKYISDCKKSYTEDIVDFLITLIKSKK